MPPEPPSSDVYTWVSPGWTPSSAPRSLAASRIWGDVVLELIAERHRVAIAPAISIRRSALFAWLRPLPPPEALGEAVGKERILLRVDPMRCAVGDIDLVDEIVDPVAWRRLRLWLVDRGFDEDFIVEDVPPLANPITSALTLDARAAVETTRADVLGSILDYFERPALAYLRSWKPLTELDDLAAKIEVVVPREAILEIVENPPV